jgi:protocatechuate 3,4-dioxygenase beta subunit
LESNSRSAETLARTRRSFLRNLSATLVAAPVAHWLLKSFFDQAAASQQNPTPQQILDEGPAILSSKIVMVAPDEPGEPLIIRGTIFASDGKMPLPGARLYVYHTDAKGLYRADQDFKKPARIRGWMKTDSQGHYEFRTIKPAPYPGGTNPAHIHPTADAPGYPARWIDEYWFEGDPFLKKDDIAKNAGLGSFSVILKLTRGSDGILRGVRDIRLT